MQDKDFEQKTREQFYQINRELADHTDRLIGLENKMDMVINTQHRLEKDITDIKTRLDRVENEVRGIREDVKYNNQLLKEFISMHKPGEL